MNGIEAGPVVAADFLHRAGLQSLEAAVDRVPRLVQKRLLLPRQGGLDQADLLALEGRHPQQMTGLPRHIEAGVDGALGRGKGDDLDGAQHLLGLHHLIGRKRAEGYRFIDEVEGIEPVPIVDQEAAPRRATATKADPPRRQKRKAAVSAEAAAPADIDRILDKINERGYDALTEEEKRTLYEASQDE